MNTMRAVALPNYFRAVADHSVICKIIFTTKHSGDGTSKCQIVLITITILVLKAKNMYWNTIKM